MSRPFRIAPIAWAVGLCVWSLHAQAQDAPRDPARREPGSAPESEVEAPVQPVDLDRITVIGSRLPRALSDVPGSISQVEEAELAGQLEVSTNILETLDVLVPGLTTSQEEFRSGCRTNIRGRPAQFLINGVPTNDYLRRSSCSSLYSVSPFAIERIEVLRGATSLFGAGAPGGAIDLQTRRARSAALETDLVVQWSVNPHEADGSGETHLYGGAGQAFAGWDYYAGVGLQDYGVRRNPDGGIVPGETFKAWSFNGSLGWDVGGGTLRLTGVFHRKDPVATYGTDFTQVSGERLAGSAFIAEPRNPYEFQSETEQSLLTASYDRADVLGHALNVSAYWHEETLVQRAADFFEGEVFYFDSDAENERQGLRASLNRVVQPGGGELDLTYGLDVLRQRYYRPQVDPASGAVIGFISPEVLLDSTAVFVQPQLRHGRWLFSGGVRHERFEGEVGSEGYDPAIPRASTPGDIPDFDLTLFNAGVVYDVATAVQVYGGFSQGAEVSEFGRAARGVQDPALINLDAATSDQYEIGVRGRVGAVDFDAAAFYSHSDKAASLQADPSCAGEPLCPLIPLRFEQTLRGVEFNGAWSLGERTRLGAVFTYQEGDFHAPGAAPTPFGADTLTPMRTTAWVEFQPLRDWHNRLQATYHASADLYDAAEEAQGFRDVQSVFLVDFSTRYPVGPGQLSLGVANLFNEKYVNVTNQASGDFFYYLSEGRRATVTWSLRF